MAVEYLASLRMRIDVHQRACTFRVKHFRGFLFALSRNNATEIVVKRGSAIHHSYTARISYRFPPAMTAFEGSPSSRASSPAPLAGTALFIVTSHLCMNPPDSIVTYTWRTMPEGNASCFLSGSRRWREWRWGYWGKAEIDGMALSSRERAVRRLLKAKLPFFSCF